MAELKQIEPLKMPAFRASVDDCPNGRFVIMDSGSVFDEAAATADEARALHEWLTRALDLQPVAYVRAVKISTYIPGVFDYDEEVVLASSGKPQGDGWTPLYALNVTPPPAEVKP